MATAYSQPLQYTPYQEQWNKELLAKALQFKQDKYDTNRQVIKDTIAKVSNIDLMKDQDAEYLYDRLQTVVNNLNTQGSGDLSLESRADYLTGYVADVADQKVMNGYIGTRAYRNVVAEHNKYEETGEASDANLAYSLRDIGEWASDGQIGSALPAGANTSYVKFTDLYEKYQEVAKGLEPDSYVVFEQFGGSGFTWYSQKGTRLDQGKLISAFNLASQSDPSVQDQLRVNAWTANRNVSDESFVATFKEDGAREKEAISKYIDRLKDAKAKSVSDAEMAELDANIAIYEEQVKQYDEALMMSDEQILANKESYQYLSYKNAYLTDLAGVFSYEQMEAPKLVTDKGSLEIYKQQQANARNSAKIRSDEQIARNKQILEEDKQRLQDEKDLKALAVKIFETEDDTLQSQLLELNYDLIERNPQYAARLGLLSNVTKKERRLTANEIVQKNDNLDVAKINAGDYSDIYAIMEEQGLPAQEFQNQEEAIAWIENYGNIQAGFDNTNSYDPRLDDMLANGQISQKQYNEMTVGGHQHLDKDEFNQFANPINTTSDIQNLEMGNITVYNEVTGETEELTDLNIQTKINQLYEERDGYVNRDDFIAVWGETEGSRIYNEFTGKSGQFFKRIVGQDAEGNNILEREYVQYDSDGDIDIKNTKAAYNADNYLWNTNADEPFYYNELAADDVRAMVNPAALTDVRRDIPQEQVAAAAEKLASAMTNYAITNATINHVVNARDGIKKDFRNIADETADNIIANGRSFRIHNDAGGFFNARYSNADGRWYIQGTDESIGEQGVRDNLRNKLGPGKMPGKDYSFFNFTKWGTGDAGTADYIELYDFLPGGAGRRNTETISLEASNDQAERITIDNMVLMTAPKENLSLSRTNEQEYMSQFISANQNNFEALTKADVAAIGAGQNYRLKSEGGEGDKFLNVSDLGAFMSFSSTDVIDQSIKNNAGSTEDSAITKTAMDGNSSIITKDGYHYIIAGYDTRDKENVEVIGAKIPVSAIDYRQYNPLNNVLERQNVAKKTAENNYYMERVVASSLEPGERYVEPLEPAQKIVSSYDPSISYTVELNQQIQRVGPGDVDYGLAVKVNKFKTDENGNTNPFIFESGTGGAGVDNIDFVWTPRDESGTPLIFDTPSDFQLYVQENYSDETANLAFAQAINEANANSGPLKTKP